ncbi:DNA cytosine methyltransferase [Aquimonas voraii]|uniref:DNA (cytosine-5-)-methyltransferase n=1 Tax=Aquimonas voraii TaxID=265719 RepID=A0A1G7AFD3_9GAMM|nr:DNA cytosine methyltransferase [Aquimonas voraii]SDE13393.1 DNA (cytosine-5)-methyltransferase 1 [Aquimonas voraii]
MAMYSIDLFAGAGGLSQGLRMAGFECLWANEFDKYAAETFSENFPAAVVDSTDIREISPADVRQSLGIGVGELAVVVGGPPCQGFSTYGKRDEFDPRNQLYRNFFSFIDEFRPHCFVMENVVGMLSMNNGEVIADVLRIASSLGYDVNVHNVRAENFGVPQRRRRVFVIGSLKGGAPSFIEPQYEEPSTSTSRVLDLFGQVGKLKPARTVRDAISDLALVDPFAPADTEKSVAYPCAPLSEYQSLMRGDASEVPNHSAKRMLGVRRLRLALMRPGDYGKQLRERIRGDGLPYAAIDEILFGHGSARDLEGCRKQDVAVEMKLREMLHEGKHELDEVLSFIDHGGFANKYRRLAWDEPSHTLVAHMARDCSDFVHPELDRFVSVREAARLQSFPDNFRLPGSQFQQFKQLGNAVPPLLGKAVGDAVVRHLSRTLPEPKDFEISSKCASHR